MNMQIVNTDDVIGADVKNSQGEDLGTIETLMIDKLQGQVAYVVLSYGGFLGMGKKLFALPWGLFSYDSKRECFIVPIDRKTLEASPGFDKDHWPDMSSQAWKKTMTDYYGSYLSHPNQH
ncbi:PRC-barrel domain-containing protein [Legionella sp. CNM-1927-20]|uniref:PRC-barrel domain-containing protein n=1 Tax=Legionella sp. CNM-1927-20 TaxID=3422221 RepID=UPI00403AFC2A